MEVGAGHAERAKDLLVRVLPQRPPGRASYDLGQEHVAGVAVQVLGSRHEVEFPLARDQPQHVLVAQDVLVRRAREPHQDEVVAHTAGVMDEMADGDGALRIRGKLGDVGAHRIVERQVAFVLGDEDGGGRELLGHRRQVEDRLPGERDPVVHLSDPVPPGEHEAPCLGHADRTAGTARTVVFREDLVDGLARLCSQLERRGGLWSQKK